MQGKSKNIPVQFPVSGLDQGMGKRNQQPQTTTDCKNVMAFDSEENRMRGGRRPGLKVKTIIPVNGKIQLIDSIVPASISGDTDVPGASKEYIGGQFNGYTANVNSWFEIIDLTDGSTVSDRSDIPLFREVSDSAPKIEIGSWEDGRYGTVMGNKDIPLLPSGNKIRTAGNGTWVMRRWNGKQVICPAPPLPYDDTLRPRGRSMKEHYYNDYNLYSGIKTNTGQQLHYQTDETGDADRTRYVTHLPSSQRTVNERASVDRLFFGGGNNKSVGDVNALPTDKMSFSSVLFPFIDETTNSNQEIEYNDPYNSGVEKNWVATCSIRPVPWDNIKNRNSVTSGWGGTYSYAVPYKAGLVENPDYGMQFKDCMRFWSISAGDWVSSDTAQHIIGSSMFNDNTQAGNTESASEYYYGMVFRIRADFHPTTDVGTVSGDVKINNSLTDESPGLFVGFISKNKFYQALNHNGEEGNYEPQFVVAKIGTAASGNNDPFKDALTDIISFDGEFDSSEVTINQYDPYDKESLMEWYDLKIKCQDNELTVSLSGEELKFPTNFEGSVDPESPYKLSLNTYLNTFPNGYIDPELPTDNVSILEGSRASTGLVFGVHKWLRHSINWFLVRNANSDSQSGNQFYLIDPDGANAGGDEKFILDDGTGADNYRLYIKTAAQTQETSDYCYRVNSYSCSREHAISEGGQLNGNTIKGYFSGWRDTSDNGNWDSGTTPARNTNYGGSGDFNNEAPIRGGGTNGADDGTGFDWVQCHYVKQLMFLDFYGADWLRTWMEPGFADLDWRAINRSDAALPPVTVVVTEGRIRDSRNNEFFGNPSGNNTFVLDTKRSVVTGTPFLDRYYFADGQHYYRFDPQTRTVEDWYAKALDAYKDSDFGDNETESISMPGGANYSTYNDPDSDPVLTPKPKLISQFMGRLVLSGKSDEPNNWWMSGTGNWWHWNTGDNVIGDSGAIDRSGPVAGNSTNLAEIGDPIRSIFPLHSSAFALATRDSIYALTDDPFADNAQLVPISLTVGVASPEAYCYAANKTLFFFSEDGLYRLQPNDFNIDKSERVSLGRLDREFANIDYNKYTIKLVYDHVHFGVHIFLIPNEQEKNQQSTKHYFYDDRNNSFWPMDYPTVAGPSYAYYYTSPSSKDKAVLYGGFDGGIRVLDRSQDSDDGAAIDSYVWIGPIFGDQVNETKLMRIAAVLDENSSILNYEIYVGDTVDNAKNSKPVLTSSWNSGRNPWQYARCRGSNIFIKVYQNGKLTPWSFEQITATVALAGQSRVRD